MASVDVLIIGAGIAGLMAASQLQQVGKRVLVLDKGHSVGGRMATRRIGGGLADHGAQFFTVRTAEFQSYVDQWQQAGLAFVWSQGWSDGALGGDVLDGYPRYAIHGGMTAMPKYLARSLNVHTDVEITAVTAVTNGWQAIDKAGRTYHSHALILTPPASQSLALLTAGHTQLETADQQALARLTYAPCLCGLFLVKGKVRLPEPGALQQLLAPISWIADNQRKGISPEAKIITVHGGPLFSQEYWDEPDESVIDRLHAVLQLHLDNSAIIQEAQIKRWHYSLPITLYPKRTLLAANLPPLAFAGDAFKEPRVEGAALSGLAAAAAIG